MKKALFLLLMASISHADVILKNGSGGVIGPVRNIQCGTSMSCSKSGYTGTFDCIPASGVSGGCLTSAAQSISGSKNFIGPMTIDGGLEVGNFIRSDWDAGSVVGAVIAKYFDAYHQHHGMGYFADGGIGLVTESIGYSQSIGSYNCSGIGGDGLGNGQACLTNPFGIVEIYGHTVGTAQEGLGQTEGLCPIELYDVGSSTLTDGGVNVGPSICLATIGTSDKVWRMMRNGDVYMDGNELRLRGARSIVRAGANGSPFSVGLELFGNILQNGGRARAAVYVTNQNFLAATDDVLQVDDSNQGGHFAVTAQGAVRLGQIITGSEPTCPGASNLNLGQTHFNTTFSKNRTCTATGWETATSLALHTLSTCASGIEGQIETDVLSGASTGKRTKACLCTSDGAAAYKWQNLATGTLGTTTTCGTE